MYWRCKVAVNDYLLAGSVCPIVLMVCFFSTINISDDELGKLLFLILGSTIAMIVLYGEAYKKYLHDIFFKRVVKKVGYVVSIHMSKRISNKEDTIIEKIRFGRIKRVVIRCYDEEQQSIIEHNRLMRERKASKKKRKHLVDVKLKEYTCFGVSMCKNLKIEDKIEITCLKGTNTIVDLKLLPKQYINGELHLDKKYKPIDKKDRYYKIKKTMGTVIFTGISIHIYLAMCHILMKKVAGIALITKFEVFLCICLILIYSCFINRHE